MSEYEEMAQRFLKDSGTKMTIRKTETVEGFPFDKNDRLPHDRYSVCLKRGDKKYSFPFYGSADMYYKRKRPTAYDVLAVLESYPVEEDLWDFANEFGYSIGSEEDYNNVRRIHKACRNQYRRLCDLYGPEWMERLAEIR